MAHSKQIHELCILVLDAERMDRKVLRHILEAAGIPEIRDAAGFESAHEELRQGGIDLVMCHWEGEPGGPAVSGELRNPERNPRFLSVPLIAIAGRADVQTVLSARDCGFNDLVVLPIAPATLRARILMAVSRPRAFVRATRYAGPDRRRRIPRDYTGPERRMRR